MKILLFLNICFGGSFNKVFHEAFLAKKKRRLRKGGISSITIQYSILGTQKKKRKKRL
jgi:hypothetical protein